MSTSLGSQTRNSSHSCPYALQQKILKTALPSKYMQDPAITQVAMLV